VAVVKLWCIRIGKTEACRLCVSLYRTRGRGWESCPKVVHVWELGFKFAFGKNKKGKVFFGILNQLKILSKYKVHAYDIKFLVVRNELLLPLKIRITEGGDVARGVQ